MPPPKMTEIHRGPYTIEQSFAISSPLEINRRWIKTSIVITWGSWILYTFLQLGLVSLIQKDTPNVLWQLWVALLAEFFLTIQNAVTALNIILALFGAENTNPRPSLRLTGHAAPSIDILVTCCGEPVDVVLNTVAAAAAQDYPSQQLRVFLLDDGHDEKLRQAVTVLKTRIADQKKASIVYLSRKVSPGAKSFFKAGNLRAGIEESERLGSSEFLAGLDADMIPEGDWLKRMVPHLLLEDKMALACPPQGYYNVPSSDPLGQQAEFDMLFTVQEPLNDRLGAAMCTGSGYVVRRRALTEIGGWPLAQTGEDFMCSALLSNAGWEIAFVRENLQSGLAPENLRAVVKQRMRWIDACIEVCQHFGCYLPGLAIISQMTWSQRAVNMLYALRDYAPLTTSLALTLLPVALFPMRTDGLATTLSEHRNYLFWIRLTFVTTFLAHKVNNFVMYKHIGLLKVANFQSHEVWAAPYMAYRCLMSLLPASMETSSFAVCGAIMSPTNECSRRHRKPLSFRLFSPDMILYTLYTIYALSPMLLRLQAYVDHDDAAQSFIPFTGAMVKLLGCIWKVLVPVRYMVWPPTVPEWGELVEVDEMGVKRPRKGWDKDETENGITWISLSICEFGVIWLCL